MNLDFDIEFSAMKTKVIQTQKPRKTMNAFEGFASSSNSSICKQNDHVQVKGETSLSTTSDVSIGEDANSQPSPAAPTQEALSPQSDDVSCKRNNDDAEEQRTKGNQAFKQGLYTIALGCYQKSISLNPTAAAVHANEALCHLKVQHNMYRGFGFFLCL